MPPRNENDRKQARALARKIGANVKRRRESAGLSRPQLGKLSDLHRSRIAGLERGDFEPRLETLLKIAHGLGLSADELLEGMEWRVAEIGRGSFVLREPEDSEGKEPGDKGPTKPV